MRSLIQRIVQPYTVGVRRARIKLQIKDTDLTHHLTYVTQPNLTYVTHQPNLTYVTTKTTLFAFLLEAPKNREVIFGLIKINLVGKDRTKRVGRDVRYFDKSGEGEGTVVYKCFQ